MNIMKAKHITEYHEDIGDVTWWTKPISEPPWIGTPNDSDWPKYHKWFTPLPDLPENLLFKN
jgi:hypothetical protein